MRKKSITRQCISCRSQLSRDCFIRIVKISGMPNCIETIIVNPSRYQFGRSVYLCKSTNCIKAAIKEKKLVKMLKVSNKATESCINELEQYQTKYSNQTERKKVIA